MNIPLQIVQSLPVSDSVLMGTDVAESIYPAWSSVATYNIGDRVHLVSTHKVYESVADSNVNNNPATAVQWSEVGPTNRWAMFDRSPTTQTARITRPSGRRIQVPSPPPPPACISMTRCWRS